MDADDFLGTGDLPRACLTITLAPTLALFLPLPLVLTLVDCAVGSVDYESGLWMGPSMAEVLD